MGSSHHDISNEVVGLVVNPEEPHSPLLDAGQTRLILSEISRQEPDKDSASVVGANQGGAQLELKPEWLRFSYLLLIVLNM